MEELKKTPKIIFFDGYCNLCNGFVDFLIRCDKKNVFHFSSLQSEIARQLLKPYNINLSALESVIYFDQNVIYEKSDAILKILNEMGSVWKVFNVFYVIPKSIRDFIYSVIAKNRYSLFGKKNTCRLPTEAEKQKFLN